MKEKHTRRCFLGAAGAGMLIGAKARGNEPAPDTSAAEARTPAGEIEWTRRVPLRYEADVAVIGGGIAGVSAAAAAARSGARVILVERFGVLGGVLTTGGVYNFCDGSQVRQPLGEVFAEIVADLDKWKAIGHERDSVFHGETLAVVLQELVLRRGVKLLLHTRLVDARTQGGRITECVVCGASGPEALRAKQWIDCSGESSLARAAGFEMLSDWYEGRWRLPMSMMYFVRHVAGERPGPFLPEGWFHPIRDSADLPMTSPWPDGPGGTAIKIKIPMFDSTDTESLTAAEIQGRRRMMEVMDYHQRVENRPWLLDHCSPIIGIREGARVAGDYVLTVDDLRAGRAFDDGVARGTFYLDGHKPDDDKRTYILPKDRLKVPPYQIPLRSLIAKDGNNVMMAGRNLSADQLALSSARVSTSGTMMGQAAGIAAALAVKKDTDVRRLDSQEVRSLIQKQGAVLDV
ncbi:MAG: FAD-dependent oxidoreductase [Thermoguttaceae bacterium]|nr:FAD-dependent oxidoreductase [Thermoguttaceae bacterium]